MLQLDFALWWETSLNEIFHWSAKLRILNKLTYEREKLLRFYHLVCLFFVFFVFVILSKLGEVSVPRASCPDRQSLPEYLQRRVLLWSRKASGTYYHAVELAMNKVGTADSGNSSVPRKYLFDDVTSVGRVNSAKVEMKFPPECKLRFTLCTINVAMNALNWPINKYRG